MFDMFEIHVGDNQNLEKCSSYVIWFTKREYIWLGEGAFSERGMFENAMYRSEGATVLTMYLYQLLSYWLSNLCSAYLMLETIISWQSIADM